MKRDYRQFWGLLREAHPDFDPKEAKELIVESFSNGRTSSLKDLTDAEYQEVMTSLRMLIERGSKTIRKKKKRSALLHQLQLYGIDTTDWQKVDEFCQDKRIAGKTFRHMSISELESAILRMRVINEKKNITINHLYNGKIYEC